MERRVIEIFGNSKNLDEFEKFLRHIEYLGNVGASRQLLISVDGDGAGQLQFKKHGERLDNKEYSTDQEVREKCVISGQYIID